MTNEAIKKAQNGNLSRALLPPTMNARAFITLMQAKRGAQVYNIAGKVVIAGKIQNSGIYIVKEKNPAIIQKILLTK